MGYGLSAAAVGEKFPWTFTYPASYWSQMSSILRYIDAESGGIKGKKIGFIYLDAGYGKEPIPLLDELSKSMGFTWVGFPVGVKEMQNQGSQWLNVRKERPGLHGDVGLGCDERHRREGSCQDQVSAGQVHRQLVGRRARRPAAGRRGRRRLTRLRTSPVWVPTSRHCRT
jgi:hypothetical protein